MKYKLHYLLLATVLTLLSWSERSMAQSTKTVYAMSDNEDFGKGIYSFELGDTINNLSLVQSLTVDAISGGLLVGDTYYYLEYQQTYNGYKVLGLYSYSMEDKVVKQIVDYGGKQQGTIANCFSYDYQEKTMYGLSGFNGGADLMKIDLETGTLSDVGNIKLDFINETAQSNGEDHLHVMTSTYDGDMYGVSYWGSLYKINQNTATAQYIGTLDYNPGDAFMYTGDCLFYDNDTDQLYLRFTTYNWNTKEWLYEVVKIDKKTAKVTRFAKVPQNSHLNAISVPFTVAEASAPTKVQNLKMIRGERGALTATMEWDNPSKTYGRGGTLEDLDYILIYRDGIRVDSIVNPVIGGHQTWTDNNITERGYYTYKFVPGNDMGHGDRARVGMYVGAGDPMAITDLKVVQDEAKAQVSWTAPTEGKLNSFIDTETLYYSIIRYKNSETVGDTLTESLKATTYEDNSLIELGKYTYAVIPHTVNATGDAVKSEAMNLGPAYTIPHTFAFDSLDEFKLWTAIDANGNDYTWDWSDGAQGSMKGVYCQYNYDQYVAADWLISPQVKFEAGKRYKMTFNALPGSKKTTEVLAITMGQGTEIETQDSVTQFNIISDKTEKLRANLPVVKTSGSYNLGLYYRSYTANYKLTLGDIVISEDHEGYVAGKVSVDGKPIAGATVIVNGGEFTATTDDKGMYELNYLPIGNYTVNVIALGYEDAKADAAVAEYETTNCDVAMTALPEYSVKGVVKDIAGDAVANATVVMSGYDNRETTTDATGAFSIAKVYKNGNYSVKINKNKLIEAQKNFGVEADTDLGTITLEDNHKPAGKITVEADDKAEANITWRAPANDAVLQRIDDGTMTTAVGIEGATDKTMFGVVKREPSSVTGVDFFIEGTPSVVHYSVRLNIFDLDKDGNPTTKLLYENTYVPAADGVWSSYTLPAPVDAPNGYYLALSYYDYLLVGIDGDGDAEQYPFVKGVNCFTSDYTTGKFLYLDNQQSADYHHNFLIRPIAAPFSVPEDSTEFKAKAPRFIYKVEADEPQPELMSKTYDKEEKEAAATVSGPKKTPQSRMRYNVYRMKAGDMADETAWTLLSEKQQARDYQDNDWKNLGQGTYAYAVKAVYTGDVLADATLSDSIGNKMLTKVTYHLTTNTPDNEAYGAKVTMVADGGAHVSTGYADDNGNVEIDNVWKGIYDVTVSLDGFNDLTQQLAVDKNDAYEFSYEITENKVKPFNLVIENIDNSTDKRFIWNYPDLFEEDFEGHDDFTINSSGNLGWQYIDGDGGETGGFMGYTWAGAGSPMAYMVFNPRTTTPSTYDAFTSLHALSGDKFLTDWAAYNKQNDDWIITPQLHFQKDFKFTFNAASVDGTYPEAFEVSYSTTDIEPGSFTILQDSTTAPAYWQQFSYDVPKEAKYVAIRCISKDKRVFMLDDISFGIDGATPYYLKKRSSMRKAPMRSPSLDGLYEVYLDGKLATQQDGTEYIFTNLTNGKHTAGVIASYTSGKTEMSTIEFTVDNTTGIVDIADRQFKMSVDNKTLTINGSYDSVSLYNIGGASQPLTKTATGTYSLNHISAGVYVVNVHENGKLHTMKFNLK